MFSNEPLHGKFIRARHSNARSPPATDRQLGLLASPAGKTVTVFSAKEMYHQLSQYAQI